jgi:hypothetical protein
MFKITVTTSFQPPNTDRWEIEFPCPICRLKTPISLGQVRREEYFICRGCHSTIKTIDQLGGIQKFKQTMGHIFL